MKSFRKIGAFVVTSSCWTNIVEHNAHAQLNQMKYQLPATSYQLPALCNEQPTIIMKSFQMGESHPSFTGYLYKCKCEITSANYDAVRCIPYDTHTHTIPSIIDEVFGCFSIGIRNLHMESYTVLYINVCHFNRPQNHFRIMDYRCARVRIANRFCANRLPRRCLRM